MRGSQRKHGIPDSHRWARWSRGLSGIVVPALPSSLPGVRPGPAGTKRQTSLKTSEMQPRDPLSSTGVRPKGDPAGSLTRVKGQGGLEASGSKGGDTRGVEGETPHSTLFKAGVTCRSEAEPPPSFL